MTKVEFWASTDQDNLTVVLDLSDEDWAELQAGPASMQLFLKRLDPRFAARTGFRAMMWQPMETSK